MLCPFHETLRSIAALNEPAFMTSPAFTRAVVVFLSYCVANDAFTAPITFIHRGFGSGSFVRFEDRPPFSPIVYPFAHSAFTITGKGDTTERFTDFNGTFYINHSAAQIAIDGLGAFDFTIQTRTFASPTQAIVGFARGGELGVDLYDGPTHPLFGTWQMDRAIGPIQGVASLYLWDYRPVETSGGLLYFNVAVSVPAEFTAFIPEPATRLLIACGIVLSTRRLRRIPAA
jgi:hypothetical protein